MKGNVFSYSCPGCGTPKQVRDSTVDHRLLHVSVGMVRWSIRLVALWGNRFAIAPVFGRSRPWPVAPDERGVRMWTDIPLMSK
jgi:hypothetical protein